MKVSPIAIILVIILGVVLLWPQISENLNIDIPQIDKLIAGNTVGVGVTIHFTDGTSEEFTPKEHNTLIPLTVTYDDKPLKGVEFFGRCKIDYTRELETVWATGYFECNSSHGEHIYGEPISFTDTSPSASNQWFTIAYLTVSDTQIEDAIPTEGLTGILGWMDITELKTKSNGNIQYFKGSAKSGVVVWINRMGNVLTVSLEVNAQHLYSS